MALHFFQCFKPWHYYLAISDYTFLEVTEEEFFNCVGTDRSVIPSYYNKRLNKESYLLGSSVIGYRERGCK